MVLETVERARGALTCGTTPYNLFVLALAPAFLPPKEIEVGTFTTGMLEDLGIHFAEGDDAQSVYPSVFGNA